VVPPWRTRIAVRAAALERQDELGCRHCLALRRVGDGKHLAQACDAGLDRLACAAGVLDRHGAERVAFGDAVFLLHPADLEDLASEPDQQDAGDVRIRGVAPLGALERLEAFALRGDAAAGAVDQRDDAVDLRIVGENS
jgi:hypothetical protein